MRIRIDLAGQRFGKLLVEREEESGDANRRWLCRCDCGGRRLVRQDLLRRGVVKSCGCLRGWDRKNEELVGRRFGRLVAREPVEGRRGHKGIRLWRCACDCGVVKIIRRDVLLRGDVNSCGCSRRKAS